MKALFLACCAGVLAVATVYPALSSDVPPPSADVPVPPAVESWTAPPPAEVEPPAPEMIPTPAPPMHVPATIPAAMPQPIPTLIESEAHAAPADCPCHDAPPSTEVVLDGYAPQVPPQYSVPSQNVYGGYGGAGVYGAMSFPQAPPVSGGLHERYPYYSYRRPWYTPGPASLNATIVW